MITVDSTPGQGSKFTLYLPMRFTGVDSASVFDGNVNPTVITKTLRADADFRGYKVLIVDDDIRNIFALTSVLKSHGMEVIYAENGIEGIETLKKNPDLHLILMDTMMPEMDGLQAIREIRKMPQFHNLPIISLTAKAMSGDREKCLEAGASDYITKPVEESSLLTMMYGWLSKFNQVAQDNP